MRRRLLGLARLARYKEYLWFVVITTLLGAMVSNGSMGWRLIVVLVANWLAVAFAFMVNDVEDAPEDALNPAKVRRNPVSAADLSPRAAWIASWVVAALAVFAYAWLGLWPFLIGIFCLALGFLYSWRPVRLKTIPILDMASHCLMLAGLQFLSAYYTFGPGDSSHWIYPFVCLISMSLYGELFNELRDYEEDVKAGITHTASFLGQKLANALMMTLLAVGIAAGLMTIFWIRLIPAWLLLLVAVIAMILLMPAFVRSRHKKSFIELQQSVQKPVEIGAAFALGYLFISAWALQYYQLVNIFYYNEIIRYINMIWRS
ncbi:MAG: UbiA family prenyltransferase [Omnitrophica WOR_2 bacterium]